jgi:hypothetical protein
MSAEFALSGFGMQGGGREAAAFIEQIKGADCVFMWVLGYFQIVVLKATARIHFGFDLTASKPSAVHYLDC